MCEIVFLNGTDNQSDCNCIDGFQTNVNKANSEDQKSNMFKKQRKLRLFTAPSTDPSSLRNSASGINQLPVAKQRVQLIITTPLITLIFINTLRVRPL